MLTSLLRHKTVHLAAKESFSFAPRIEGYFGPIQLLDFMGGQLRPSWRLCGLSGMLSANAYLSSAYFSVHAEILSPSRSPGPLAAAEMEAVERGGKKATGVAAAAALGEPDIYTGKRIGYSLSAEDGYVFPGTGIGTA